MSTIVIVVVMGGISGEGTLGGELNESSMMNTSFSSMLASSVIKTSTQDSESPGRNSKLLVLLAKSSLAVESSESKET